MKQPRFLVLAAVVLSGCLSVKPDGRAIECIACEAIWLKLDPEIGVPGTYRVIHGDRKNPCRKCEKLAAAYLDGGPLQARCQDCGGEMAYRPVVIR